MFDFIGTAIDSVLSIFGTSGSDIVGSLVTAGIKTAGEFIIGGTGSGQQQGSSQSQPQSKVHAGVATSRTPRPSTPAAAGVVDPEDFYNQFVRRMGRYITLASAADTGNPRTLGTQARRT